MLRTEPNQADRTTQPDHRLSSVWDLFAEKLKSVLAGMREDQYLILTPKDCGSVFIQFAAQGAWGWRIETTGNYYRSKDNQLSESQQNWLLDRGWCHPTRDPENSTPSNDPIGSPNWFVDMDAPVDYGKVVQMAVDALVEILGVNHPASLQYEALERSGDSISLPQLGLKLRIAAEDDFAKGELRQKLLDTVSELTNLDDLGFDGDGDIGITFKGITAYIRLVPDRPHIRVYSLLMREVEESLRVYQVLNEVNSDNGFLHVILSDGVVLAFSDILTTPFVTSSVAHTVGNFFQVADDIKNLLQAEFGEGSVLVEQPSPLRH